MGKLVLPVDFKAEISNLEELDKTVKDAEQLIEEAKANAKKEAQEEKMSEFDKSLRVEGLKQSNVPMTQYRPLDPDMSRKLTVVLKDLTRADLSNLEEINGAEGQSSNGEPFKCYATLDGFGNLIVTPEKVISIRKKDDTNYDYEETRKNQDGSLRKVSIHTVNGISNYAISNYDRGVKAKEIREADTFTKFATNPKNEWKMEMSKMNKQEQAAYVLELRRLGIDVKENVLSSADNISPAQAEIAKEQGHLYHIASSVRMSRSENGFDKKALNILYRDYESVPRTIWMASQDGSKGEIKNEAYRRTSSGKYLDTNSLTFVNGVPKYNLVTLDSIIAKAEQQGVNIDLVNQVIAKNNEMDGKMPQEAGTIADNAQKQLEKGKEAPEQEEDLFPGMPNY